MFWKTFAIGSAEFFPNEGGIEGILCKKIKILLTY